MTDHRQLLELAARAIGRNFVPGESWDEGAGWNPLEDDGDCAMLCAALGIDTEWLKDSTTKKVLYACCTFDSWNEFRVQKRIVQMVPVSNDRSAAWRLAALRVAAEIGKGTRG